MGRFIDNKRYFVVGFIAGCQIVLLLMFKLYFFGLMGIGDSYTSSDTTSSSSSLDTATPP